jgi:curved DNA-binding protein CbpA
MTRDYYRTLGLIPDSSAEEIKKEYRKLAMQYHPDRNGGNPKSEEHLKEINEAYQILGDEEKRRLYDLQYRQSFENYVFHERGLDNDFVTVLRMFSQKAFNTKRTGGCGRRGAGRGSCGKWRRNFL